MEEQKLDILELIETLKKNKPSRFFKNEHNIMKLVMIAAYESTAFLTNNVPYTVIVNLIIPLIVRELYKSWKKLDDVQGIIVDEIRKTSDYKKCVDLYNEYIKRLADFISKFNFTNIKEITFYFDMLLTNGFLSSNFRNIYKNYDNDNNYIVEILGARTLGGASVCRHMSALAADCLNELGEKAEILTVANTDNITNLNSTKDLENLSWSHGVVGIADKTSKFLYDPTTSRLCGKSNKSNPALEEFITKISFVNPDSYLVISPKQYSFSKSHNSLYELSKLPLETLNENEIFALREKIINIFAINENLACQFAIENLNLIKEISGLESNICPHSDSPILKWQLNK